MERAELDRILAEHGLWLSGRGGVRADLTGANLTGAHLTGADLTGAYLARANLTGADLTGAYLARANLTGADLTGANLAGADLTGAYLTGADLTGAHGVRWAAIGPVGQGRRMLTAYRNGTTPVPMITGGCFHGTFAEFREIITGLPWDWGIGTTEQVARWRRECSDAADLLELAVSE